MANRWTLDEDVDDLDVEFEDLAPVGRGRKPKKRVPARLDEEFLDDDRDDKRRKRRWEAPPHKRATDFEVF
jgi:hypothetical protein